METALAVIAICCVISLIPMIIGVSVLINIDTNIYEVSVSLQQAATHLKSISRSLAYKQVEDDK